MARTKTNTSNAKTSAAASAAAGSGVVSAPVDVKAESKAAKAKAKADAKAAKDAARIAEAKAAEKAAPKPAKASKKEVAKKKPNIFKRFANYCNDVKAEMKRVTWPTKQDIWKSSLVVVGALVFFGLLIFAVDSAIVPLLTAYSGVLNG